MSRSKLRAYARVFRRSGVTSVPELQRLLRRRPAIMAGVGAYEAGLLASGSVEGRLRALAQVRAAARIGCLF